MGGAPPSDPKLFLRTPQSLVGHRQSVVCPSASKEYDFEGELGVVIGRGGRRIPPDRALSHVAGYTCFFDGSVRDYQKHSFTAGKNFDSSGACGPWLVPASEVPDPQNLLLTTRVNGEVLQQANTAEMIFSVADIISYISIFTHLEPGDVIATGTPAGVGAGRKPPLWMKPGDRVEVEIERIGTLANTVISEPSRPSAPHPRRVAAAVLTAGCMSRSRRRAAAAATTPWSSPCRNCHGSSIPSARCAMWIWRRHRKCSWASSPATARAGWSRARRRNGTSAPTA